jgi:hypothetical protein
MAGNTGARAKLRIHFLNNVGRIMDSDELREVAGGITEWGRRVRELRNEEGYQILTHNDRNDLKPGQYLLLDAKPVPAFARAYPKNCVHLSWIAMGSLARCVGQWLVKFTHTIPDVKPGFISAIRLINPWAGPMRRPTCVHFVLSAMRVRET